MNDKIDSLNRLVLSSKSIGVINGGTSPPASVHLKVASYSNGEMLRSRSLRSSAGHSMNGSHAPSLYRTMSGASTNTISARFSNISSPHMLLEIEHEDETMDHFADGTATLQAQNKALQSDLIEKAKYISTLEKRLLQARRSSHSRTSATFTPVLVQPRSPTNSAHGEDGSDISTTLQEKDSEIAELKAKLVDQEKALTALRVEARKYESNDTIPDNTAFSPITKQFPSHQSNDSHGSSVAGNMSLSPVELLSSSHKVRNRELDRDMRRKSVDEMSRMLDEMIQDRVDNGQLVRSIKGSVRPVAPRRKESIGPVPGLAALARSQRANEERLSEGEELML